MIDLSNLTALEMTLPTLSADEKTALQTELDNTLAMRGKELETHMKAAATATAEYEAVLKAWKEQPEIKALAEAEQTIAERRDELKAELQKAAILRQKLTGEKTWQAFQCAMSWTPKYDDAALLAWALTHAPGEVRSQLIALNKTAANALVKSRADDQGILKGYEGAAAIPAMVEQTFTGKVLTDKLASLEVPKPLVTATSDPVTISVVPNPVAVLTAPEPKVVVVVSEPETDEIPF